ncbi:MAG: PilZ domain-containing protein [Phycisphaerae bacterium]|nr:PilZ domain-containing protein [Phycisphaerae bacterium]
MDANAMTERRREARTPSRGGVKVYDRRSRRYRPARLRNLSSGGALIQVYGGLHARVGDRVDLALSDSVVVGRRSLKRATVVRADLDGPCPRVVALQFLPSIQLSAAA